MSWSRPLIVMLLTLRRSGETFSGLGKVCTDESDAMFHTLASPFPARSRDSRVRFTDAPTSSDSCFREQGTAVIRIQRSVALHIKMPVFQSKKFPSARQQSTTAAKYRAMLSRHPFALFGLPFIATMVLGSFFLTPATALRYERYDRKVRQMTKEEELGIGKDRRKIDLQEEYYVSIPCAMQWTE